MPNYNQEKVRNIQKKLLEMLIELDSVCNKHDIKYWLDAGTFLGAVRHEGFIPWDDDLDIGMLREDYEKFIEVCKGMKHDFLILQNYDPLSEPSDYYDNTYINRTVPTKIRHRFVDYEEKLDKYCFNKLPKAWIDIFPFDIVEKESVNAFKKNKSEVDFICKLMRNRVSSKLFKKIYSYLIKPVSSISLYKKHLAKIKTNISAQGSVITYGAETRAWSFFEKDKFFPLKDYLFEGHYFPGPQADYYLTEKYGDYMKLPDESERVPSHV